MAAAPWIVDDELCAVIEPLPPERPAGTPGPAQMDPRLVLQGILFVLFTGIGWEDLPPELGFGSGMTCWCRLRGWQAADVREDASGDVGPQSRCGADRFRPRHGRRLSHPGEKGGAATGPSPVDRAKTGSKHHVLTCANGFPLAVTLSAANVNDHLLPELLDRVRPLRGRCGPPRHRIKTLIADKGYDYPRVYEELRQCRITGHIPRPGTRDKVTAGRWIVEQTLALLHQFRRLATRWERRTDIHHGLLHLAAALICWRRVGNRTG
ncbi:IS5 family transposase [Nocardia higoensis]|uniref:IS5 family transposase n=1 Tax=Nocardia higoensis TaxID=228599 RepID=UPI002B4B476B|nr:IS5 family transposase [Nocardia higoensis]